MPDKRVIFEMTRSHYQRLYDAGVELYEYELGFIHAKSYLVDDEYAMIGTINLDYRRLVHHFENGVQMYRCGCIEAMKRDFERTRAVSIRVDAEMLKPTVPIRLLRSLGKIFFPLL